MAKTYMNTTLDTSFDTLETAFSDESRKVVRELKMEWQKIVKYRDDVSEKQVELISAKDKLNHLNMIKFENEKYLKSAQSRMENLKQTNIQLKSKLNNMKKEDEKAAKKFVEDQEYKDKKLALYEEKWRQRYETHYSKNPKIKEKVRAIKELEDMRQRLYTLDDELQKCEKELFQAKCTRNKRAIEESRFYPFSSFVVTIAKMYLKTKRENEECQILSKEISVIQKNIDAQEPAPRMELKEIDNSNDDSFDKSKLTGFPETKDSIENVNFENKSDNFSSPRYKIQNWNEKEKIKSLQIEREHHTRETEREISKESKVQKWMERYKICIPKFKGFSNKEANKSVKDANRREEKEILSSTTNMEEKSSFHDNPNNFYFGRKITEPIRKTEPTQFSNTALLPFHEEQSKSIIVDSSRNNDSVSNHIFPQLHKEQSKSLDIEFLKNNDSMQFSKHTVLQFQEEQNKSINTDSSRNYTPMQNSKHTQPPFAEEQNKSMDIDPSRNNTSIQNSKHTLPLFDEEQSKSLEIHSQRKNDSMQFLKNTAIHKEESKFMDIDSSSNNHSTRYLKYTLQQFPVVQNDDFSGKNYSTEFPKYDVPSLHEVQNKSLCETEEMDIDNTNNLSNKEKVIDTSVQFESTEQRQASLKNVSKYFQNLEINCTTNEYLGYTKAEGESMTKSFVEDKTEATHAMDVDGVSNRNNQNHEKQNIGNDEIREFKAVDSIRFDELNIGEGKIERHTENQVRGSGEKFLDSYTKPNPVQEKQTSACEEIQQDMPAQNLYSSHTAMVVENKKQEENFGKNINTDVNRTEEKYLTNVLNSSQNDNVISSSGPSTSANETPQSNIYSPKNAETFPKTPVTKSAQNPVEEENTSIDIPSFPPFNIENSKSPGFTYTTRLMYQASTSNAKQDAQNMPGELKSNMFTPLSFFNIGNNTNRPSEQPNDDEKNDFLASAYEAYFNDSPPMMKQGTEKNMFAFADDSPEQDNGPGGFFPLFASDNNVESNKDSKPDTPFMLNFGGPSSVKSPEESSGFKFLF